MKRFTKFAITLLAVGLALFAIPTKKSAPVSSEGRLLNYHAAKGLYEAAGFGEGVAEAQAVSSVFPQNFPACGPAGCYFSSPLLLPNGSAAAPSIGFASTPTAGWYYEAASGRFVFRGLTNEAFAYYTAMMFLPSTGQFGFTNGPASSGTLDTILVRDGAANTLALRNGGTAGAPVPQTFNVYNFCDGAACVTGYERGVVKWNGVNQLLIGTENAGTGSPRANIFQVGGAGYLIQSTTAFYPNTTDSYSLGASGNQFQNVLVSRAVQGFYSKSLTDAAGAVSFVRIAVPTNANMGGKLIYTATSTDGGNGSLTSTAEYNFSGADDDGVVTCGISAQLGVAPAYARANTLLCTVTTVTSTTNCDLQATCTDNKAGAQTVTFNWRLNMPIPNTVTPQ